MNIKSIFGMIGDVLGGLAGVLGGLVSVGVLSQIVFGSGWLGIDVVTNIFFKVREYDNLEYIILVTKYFICQIFK